MQSIIIIRIIRTLNHVAKYINITCIADSLSFYNQTIQSDLEFLLKRFDKKYETRLTTIKFIRVIFTVVVRIANIKRGNAHLIATLKLTTATLLVIFLNNGKKIAIINEHIVVIVQLICLIHENYLYMNLQMQHDIHYAVVIKTTGWF